MAAFSGLGSQVIAVAQYLVDHVQSVSVHDQQVYSARSILPANETDTQTSEFPHVFTLFDVENDDQSQALFRFKSGIAGVIDSSHVTSRKPPVYTKKSTKLWTQ